MVQELPQEAQEVVRLDQVVVDLLLLMERLTLEVVAVVEPVSQVVQVALV